MTNTHKNVTITTGLDAIRRSKLVDAQIALAKKEAKKWNKK